MTKHSVTGMATCALLALGMLGTVAHAAAFDREGDLVEISGPEAMLARGLPADHAPILALRSSGESRPVDASPDEFGTDDRDFISVFGNAFVAASSNAEWGTTDGNALFCRSGASYQFFDAQFLPPIGSLMSGIRAWGHDTDAAENLYLYFWEECQPSFSAGAPVLTELIDETISAGSPGEFSDFTAFASRTANTFECVYRVRIAFGDGACNGFSLRFYKARLQFERQISPAPVAATFGDVPSGHPFFQHIEALVASGITAGCGSGNYCPDSPLTRGQMAVFLSKALGLHWSEESF